MFKTNCFLLRGLKNYLLLSPNEDLSLHRPAENSPRYSFWVSPRKGRKGYNIRGFHCLKPSFRAATSSAGHARLQLWWVAAGSPVEATHISNNRTIRWLRFQEDHSTLLSNLAFRGKTAAGRLLTMAAAGLSSSRPWKVRRLRCSTRQGATRRHQGPEDLKPLHQVKVKMSLWRAEFSSFFSRWTSEWRMTRQCVLTEGRRGRNLRHLGTQRDGADKEEVSSVWWLHCSLSKGRTDPGY